MTTAWQLLPFNGTAAFLRGHFHTLGPFLSGLAVPPLPPPSRHVEFRVHDPVFTAVVLSGRLSEQPGGEELLLVVHGLGGSAASGYAARAARTAWATGLSVLRLNLRGADRRGEDYYHAGLSDDLHDVLASPLFERYQRIYVLGYSMGGHVALHYCAGHPNARVLAVAAVCSPLDLARTADAFDAPRFSVYRRHVLAGLQEMYAEVARRRPVPISTQEASGIRHIRTWDERVVAPRHGFANASDYYETASVGPRLGDIHIPGLVLHGKQDPMVPIHAIADALRTVNNLDVRVVDGGHIGFAQNLSLGEPGPAGLEPQVIAWLRNHACTPQ